ncbi:MAG: response regulator [Phycisphaerae bacterium]|nr:response regulator [Phycisphaerales bacterium]
MARRCAVRDQWGEGVDSAIPQKILLVESNPRAIETLIDAFVGRFNCNITCVATAEDALDVDMLEPHSIVVADTELEGMDALTMAMRLTELNPRPIIMLDSNPTVANVVEAMRAGVVDYFSKPVDIDVLLESMDQALADYQAYRDLASRHQKMRGLVRRVIRERRELNQRVELICKDLVGAHKRLVMRVLEGADGVEVA